MSDLHQPLSGPKSLQREASAQGRDREWGHLPKHAVGVDPAETCKQFALESSSSGCKFSVGGEDDDPEVIFMKPLDRDSKVPNKKDFFFHFSNNKTHLKKLIGIFLLKLIRKRNCYSE